MQVYLIQNTRTNEYATQLTSLGLQSSWTPNLEQAARITDKAAATKAVAALNSLIPGRAKLIEVDPANRPDEPQILEIQGTPVYKIVQTVEGKMVATTPTSIHAWAHANHRAVYNVARVSHLRPELQVQPKVQGLLGPMWDGFNAQGQPVVRYEDQATYDTLSR